jgi:hypothetical protein
MVGEVGCATVLRARRALATAGGAGDRRVRQGRGTGCARKGRGAGGCLRREDKSCEGRSTRREDDKPAHARCSMPRQLTERGQAWPGGTGQGPDRARVRPGITTGGLWRGGSGRGARFPLEACHGRAWQLREREERLARVSSGLVSWNQEGKG